MPVEEVYAHSLNMCVGVVGVVSLLLATSLRPQPGNPVSCELMHTHRNRDVLFLGTKWVVMFIVCCIFQVCMLLQAWQASGHGATSSGETCATAVWSTD